jgi:transposase
VALLDPDPKIAALRSARALNPRPDAVRDEAFTSGDPFFDPRDLIQVKYEMLRRVLLEGQPVTATAAAFGFSRPSFYAAQAAWQAAGLPGLLPARPGPRSAHKLTSEVVTFLVEQQTQQPRLRTAELVELLKEHFGLLVHPRSVERALARHRKKV